MFSSLSPSRIQRAVKAVSAYMKAQSLPLSQAVVQLDSQYGNGAIVADLAGLAYVMRGKDYDGSICLRCKPA